MKQAQEKFWLLLEHLIDKTNPHVMTGDFNMALLQVVHRLRRTRHPAELISWYAFTATEKLNAVRKFREHAAAAGAASPADDRAPAEETGAEAVAGVAGRMVLLDSCGIFSLKKLYRCKSQMTLEAWDDPQQLDPFRTGQGYPIESYIGGDPALRASLRRERSLEVPADAEGAARVKMLIAKGKLAKFRKFDATERLFTAGGHMPLVAYFGSDRSGRKEDKLKRREASAARRGWGPRPGGRRSKLMQAQGKGPPPGHDAFLARTARRRQERERERSPAAPAAAAADPPRRARGRRGREGWDPRQEEAQPDGWREVWAAQPSPWSSGWDQRPWRAWGDRGAR